MADKRPCRICKKWFLPDPRVGARQKVCSTETCQRERNRKSCAIWQAQHPEQVEAAQFRRRLKSGPPVSPDLVARQPMAKYPPRVVQHGVGVKVQVLLEEVTKVLAVSIQHGVPAKGIDIPGKPPKVLPRVPPTADGHPAGGPLGMGACGPSKSDASTSATLDCELPAPKHVPD
jgi:hypothetical protein